MLPDSSDFIVVVVLIHRPGIYQGMKTYKKHLPAASFTYHTAVANNGKAN
jgi:hypothetical protein